MYKYKLTTSLWQGFASCTYTKYIFIFFGSFHGIYAGRKGKVFMIFRFRPSFQILSKLAQSLQSDLATN